MTRSLEDDLGDLVGALVDGNLEDVEVAELGRIFNASQQVWLDGAVRSGDLGVASGVPFGAAVVGAAEDGKQLVGKVALEAFLLAVAVLVAADDQRQVVRIEKSRQASLGEE